MTDVDLTRDRLRAVSYHLAKILETTALPSGKLNWLGIQNVAMAKRMTDAAFRALLQLELIGVTETHNPK